MFQDREQFIYLMIKPLIVLGLVAFVYLNEAESRPQDAANFNPKNGTEKIWSDVEKKEFFSSHVDKLFTWHQQFQEFSHLIRKKTPGTQNRFRPQMRQLFGLYMTAVQLLEQMEETKGSGWHNKREKLQATLNELDKIQSKVRHRLHLEKAVSYYRI